MRISADGNVGIGTTSPSQTLDVESTSTVVSEFNSRNASNSAEIHIRTNGGTGNNIRSRIVAGFQSGGSNFGGFLAFNTTSTQNINNEHMRITSAGLVGINETSPSAQLQVKSGSTGRVPLIVDTLASHATNLQEWRVNGGTALARVDVGGLIATPSVFNLTSINNSRIDLENTGVVIGRNVADANVALIVNQSNASSTGDIVRFRKAGVSQAIIANNGVYVGETRPRLNDITANATLALVDEGKVLRVNSSSNLTITIPLNSSVAFPTNTEIAVLRYGTGTVSISPTSGVTLNSKNAERKISGQYGSVALKKIGTDEWVLVGSLEA
jgi:hypothetical protein